MLGACHGDDDAHDAAVVDDQSAVDDIGGPRTPLAGFLSMGGTDALADGGTTVSDVSQIAGYSTSFAGLVLTIEWRALEPTQGALDTSSIDSLLTKLALYNSVHLVAPLAVQLRVLGGATAPDWAKSIGGAPVVIADGQTVGRWWTAEYRAAWQALQAKLATQYDENALVRTVDVTSCAIGDEPFASYDAVTRAALVAAGDTDAAQQACLTGAIADYGAWTQRSIEYPFAVFTRMDGTTEAAFTVSVMQSCTDATRCVLSAHDLGSSLDGAVFAQMKAQVAAGGSSVSVRTEDPPRDWCATILNANALSAQSVAIWPDAFGALSAAQLTHLVAVFETGLVSDPSLCPSATDGGT